MSETQQNMPVRSAGESLKSRKFLFSVGVFIVDTALVSGGFISDVVWGQVSVGVILAYLTGNVTQNIFGRR